MQLFVIFAIFLATHCHARKDDYVTVWIPKTISIGQSVRTSVLWASVEVGLDTKVAVQIGNAYRTAPLSPNSLSKYVFGKTGTGSQKVIEGTVTMYRKHNNVHKCVSKSYNVKFNDNKFYIFIQTDKPIYKPKDNVRFRVIVVDVNLKPFHMNNIDVDMIDPQGTVHHTFTNMDKGRHFGVFNESYPLQANTPIGDWKIRVMVNKQMNKIVSRKFNVQKYAFKLFNVKIKFDENILYGKAVDIMLYAEYPFGGAVKGNAVAIIEDENKKVLYKKTYKDITCSQSFTVNTKTDLKLKDNEPSNLKVTILFTEIESRTTIKASKQLNVFTDRKYKMDVKHSEFFMPGHSFPIIFKLFDWKNSTEIKSFEFVDIKCYFKDKNGKVQPVLYAPFPHPNHNIAEVKIIIPQNAIAFEIEAKYINSEFYRKKIEIGTVSIKTGHLYVSHQGTKLKLGDCAYITVSRASDQMDEIVYDVMTRHGCISSNKVTCGQICKFSVLITEQMMPQSTVVVYYVEDKGVVRQGSTVISTTLIGPGELNMTLTKNNEIISSPVQTKNDLKLKFDTNNPKSSVFYIAYDERLLSFNIPNDFKASDVVKKVANYDEFNNVIVLDMNEGHECTNDELERIKTGNIAGSEQSGDCFNSDQQILDHETNLIGKHEEIIPADAKDGSLREYFPEVWLFDKASTDKKGHFEMDIKVPDVMTTWIFNAFSFDNRNGLAIAHQLELKVQNEFFIVINLPYSIRFKEVFPLDVIVFNYKKDGVPLDVYVELKKIAEIDFTFVTEVSKCNFKPNSKSIQKSATETIPYYGSMKFTFLVQSHKEHDDQRPMTMRFKATAISGVNLDTVVRMLKVEPVGIKRISYEHKSDYCNGKIEGSFSELANKTSDRLSYTNQWFIAGGNYLTRIPAIDKFSPHPQDCLQQATSRMKGDAERFRFLKFGKFIQTEDVGLFNQNFQTILGQMDKYSYRNQTGYRAHLIDALATSISVGVLPNDDHNKNMIENEFDAIIADQNADGSFSNFGKIPSFSCQYSQTSYILVQFLKHRGVVDRSYDEAINRGFKYLDTNRLEIKNFGLSIAAYAYALRGNIKEANEIVQFIESNNVVSSDLMLKRCFKVNRNDKECNALFTANAAMAYFELNENTKAIQLVNWLVDDNLKSIYSSYSLDYALLTEPIARVAKFIGAKDTMLTIVAENELSYKTQAEFTFTSKNCSTEQNKLFPQESRKMFYTVNGDGFYAVTRVVEMLHTAPQSQSIFNISATVDKDTVEVCGMNMADEGDEKSIVNVIYEVDMPSGYTYLKIDNTNNILNHLKVSI
ncbi:hypothetical protein ACKWTF_014213 [Chironomus riparius]